MSRWLTIAATAVLVSCGSPRVVKTALHGDLATLKQQIQAEQKAGTLTERRVEELAWAVAGRELRSADPRLAVRRVVQARDCAEPLVPVLQDRAQLEDDAGAEAALLLFEIDHYGAPAVERYGDSPDGAWRAVAARAAIAPEYAELRRQYYLDPDQRVRRAAFTAAGVSPNPDHRGELLEAARLDPDPMSRNLATQALGAVGDPTVVLALKDYWVRASQDGQLVIVEAWANASAYASGGREQLIRIAETDQGFLALSAAEALTQKRGAEASIGVARLLNAITNGTTEERRLAIRLAPWSDAQVRTAIEAAADDDDRQVRVLALARLLGDASAPQQARQALRELAQGKDPTAWQAQAALAVAGDTAVRSLLQQELDAPRSFRRQLAAISLLRLGDYQTAAAALADDDPAVRMRVSCTVLALH